MMRWSSIAYIALCCFGCSRVSGPGGSRATGNRADALAAFATDVEPEVQTLLDTVIFAKPTPITWTAPPLFGMQESANPMSLDNPYARGDRILREGKLPDGAKFVAEGFYSYKKKVMQSVNVIIDYPDTSGAKRMGNVPIEQTLLSSVGLRPSLIMALLSGLGKGSMSSSNPINYQASAQISGKSFEVTTAVHRGQPLRLELTCLYFR